MEIPCAPRPTVSREQRIASYVSFRHGFFEKCGATGPQRRGIFIFVPTPQTALPASYDAGACSHTHTPTRLAPIFLDFPERSKSCGSPLLYNYRHHADTQHSGRRFSSPGCL